MTTISDLLFDAHADAAAELAAAIARTPQVLSRLSVAGLSIPGLDVANAITTLLELPISNIAVKGWKEHQNIIEAKQRTAASPDSREVVRLLEHRIRSKTEPLIEAEVNGIDYPLLRLTLEVELRLSTADVIVQGGEVTDIRVGSSTAKATLSASKVVLATKQFRELDPERTVEAIDPEKTVEAIDPEHADGEHWPPPPGGVSWPPPPSVPPPPSARLVSG